MPKFATLAPARPASRVVTLAAYLARFSLEERVAAEEASASSAAVRVAMNPGPTVNLDGVASSGLAQPLVASGVLTAERLEEILSAPVADAERA